MSSLHERPFLTFVQISDAHVGPPGALSHDGVDNELALARAMDGIARSNIPIDAVIFSGDLVEDGDAASYAQFREIVSPTLSQLGAAVVAVPGNHDSRGGVREFVGADPSRETVDTVTVVGGVSIIGLDSSRPGREEGDLSDEQLDWLSQRLAEAGPGGAVVVIHHPPMTIPVGPGIDIALDDPRPLQEILAGSSARLVLTGHSHFAGAGLAGGVPVWVGGAVCSNTVRLTTGMQTVASTLVSRIDLDPDARGGHFVASVPFGDERVLREIAPEDLRYRSPR